MSSSAIKTRNMTSTGKTGEHKQILQAGMGRYLKKTVDDPTVKQKLIESPSRKSPKRNKKQQKSKSTRETPRKSANQVDTDNEELNSDPEVFSDSDVVEEVVEENATLESIYNNLAELENEVEIELDPRTISLAPDAQPLLLLSLLKKIEFLEKSHDSLKDENESLKTALNYNIEKTNDLEKDVKNYKKEMEDTKQNVDNVKASNKILKEESAKLKEKTTKAESYSRRNNLRFDGIPQDKNETPAHCREKIYSILKMELNMKDAESRIIIDRCHRDPRYPNNNPSSILVRFLSFGDRDEIWQNRDKLNRNQRNRLFVNEDFPPEVERKRAFLRPYVKAAYRTGKKAVLVGDNIMVEGLKYTVDELDKLPADMGPDKVAIRHEGNTMLFYRSDAYMSNFHKSEMSMQGVKYNCVEQFFTAEKARKFNDMAAVNKIMKAENPSEMKYHGKNIKSFNQKQWDEIAATAMITGLRAKFAQNPILKAKLASTGECELAEASKHDTVWGIGMPIHDPKAHMKEHWLGKNQLGNLLMKVRDEIVNNRL